MPAAVGKGVRYLLPRQVDWYFVHEGTSTVLKIYRGSSFYFCSKWSPVCFYGCSRKSIKISIGEACGFPRDRNITYVASGAEGFDIFQRSVGASKSGHNSPFSLPSKGWSYLFYYVAK